MARIAKEQFFNGAQTRIARLGLEPLLQEVREVLDSLELRVKEERDANGGAAVRKLIDGQFQRHGGWTIAKSGDIDWTKCHVVNGTRVCVGVEVQVSARSDLLVIDVIHLRKALVAGQIDVGVLIVPSDRLGVFLTDRGPRMADAKRHVREARADDLPLVLIALEHDGPGPAPGKRAKRSRRI